MTPAGPSSNAIGAPPAAARGACRRRWLWAALAAIATVAAPSAAAQESSEPLIRTSIPAGFENLSAPQTSMVDVFYLGKQVDLAMATFAPGAFSFEDPQAVVARLPGIAKPGVVELGLTGDLDPNALLACGARPRQGCGELDPDSVGIIFDATRFRVDIFVNPSLLVAAGAGGPRYLPDPDAGFSALQTLAVAVAGTNSNGPDYTLRSFSLLAYGTGRVKGEVSRTSHDGVNLDVLATEVDRHAWRYIGGLYRTALSSILGERRLMGVGIATTAETRLDLEQIEGTPISVFLPIRAQVEILRDGRLLSSRTYPAGNQAIDTTDLPEGAYEITLRIRERDGSVRDETRFFAKTSLVPPQGAPRYVLEAGLLGTETTSLDQFADTPAAHAGTTHRLTESFALGADAVVTQNQQTAELSAFYLATFSTFSVSTLVATDGSVGVAANTYGTFQQFSYGLTARRIWSQDDRATGPRDDRAQLIQRGSTRLDLTLSYTFAAGTRLGWRTSWQDQAGSDGSYAFGPSLYWPLPPLFGSRLDLISEVTHSGDETQAMARLRVQFETPSYSITSSQGYVASFGRRASDSGTVGRVDAYWKDGDLVQGDLRAGGGVIQEFGDTSLRAQSDYRGPNGNALGYVEQSVNGDLDTLYGANALVHVMGNADRVTWGGEDSFRSGILIAVDGEADAAFTILIDGRPRGTVKVGQRIPLMLPEYHVYDVRLQPIGAPPIVFDSATREVSLYPGTIKTLRWQVEPLFVVYGRLLDGAGEPLAFAPLEGGTERSYTDANGYFQLEVAGADTLKVTGPGVDPCVVQLQKPSSGEELVDLGEVTCS